MLFFATVRSSNIVPKIKVRGKQRNMKKRHHCSRASTGFQRRGYKSLTLTMEQALDHLREAIRARSFGIDQEVTDCTRLFNDNADGIPGFVLERYGEVLIAQLHEGRLVLDESAVRNLCAAGMEILGARAVYRKIFATDRSASLHRLESLHCDPTPWVGAAVEPEFPVRENGMTYLIRPYAGFSVGLFPEHRDNRKRAREIARGGVVLNTFAYTCGFSVAAALGGADLVVSVDASMNYLNWGRRNFQANNLDPDIHEFRQSDVSDFLELAAKKRRRFDLIILDPPTFGRTKRPQRVFSLVEDLDRLVARAADLLNPSGSMLLAVNHRDTSYRRMESCMRAVSGSKWDLINRASLPMDYAGDRDFAKFVWGRRAGEEPVCGRTTGLE